MLIVCPTCATAYQIQLAALGAAGRSVRCAHCKNTWFATPDSVIEEAAPALAVAGRRRPRPAPPPAPPPPAPDDFDATTASDFSVEAFTPLDDAAADEAGKRSPRSDAPPLAPAGSGRGAKPSASKFDPGEPEDIETIAARRARQTYAERKAKRDARCGGSLSLPVLIVALAAILLGALQWRAAVVRHFPQTASLFCHDRDAGQSARPDLPGREEHGANSMTVSWCWWSKA